MNSTTKQFRCETCKAQIVGDDRTGHMKSAHVEQFAAIWSQVEAAAARYRAR